MMGSESNILSTSKVVVHTGQISVHELVSHFPGGADNAAYN
jgi:hypothetical protein